MINDIIVLDNIIPEAYQQLVKDDVLSLSRWAYVADVAHPPIEVERMRNEGKEVYNSPGFGCGYYSNREGLQHPLWFLLKPILWQSCAQINYTVTEVVACRGFLTMPDPHSKQPWDNPHVDFNFSHTVCLYYLDDSDGDTVFFNANSQDIPMNSLDRDSLSVIKTVTPRRGRVVLFDGNFYHSSTRGSSGTRCVINYCFV